MHSYILFHRRMIAAKSTGCHTNIYLCRAMFIKFSYLLELDKPTLDGPLGGFLSELVLSQLI